MVREIVLSLVERETGDSLQLFLVDAGWRGAVDWQTCQD